MDHRGMLHLAPLGEAAAQAKLERTNSARD
jgi:hypothetical protein